MLILRKAHWSGCLCWNGQPGKVHPTSHGSVSDRRGGFCGGKSASIHGSHVIAWPFSEVYSLGAFLYSCPISNSSQPLDPRSCSAIRGTFYRIHDCSR